jgi:exodeoxyribonuclease VII small subunit
MDFEENLKKLEEISSNLEKPNISMNDGIKLYEEGIVLAKDCYKQLNDIKGKVTILKADIDKYKEEIFE